jgi:hypothetical protein
LVSPINSPTQQSATSLSMKAKNFCPVFLSHHVFNGEVALHQASGPEKLVKGGQSLSFATDLKQLAANPANFVSLNEIVARNDSSDREQFHHWQAQSAKMKSDPGLRLYFDLQDDPGPRSLRNRAPQGEDASIVGTSWTAGCWPGKRALDFRKVAVVFDPAAEKVRHYANGTLLARLPIEDSSPLKIGNATPCQEGRNQQTG